MPGAERLRDSDKLIELLQDQRAAGKLYAAICAAPAVVLEHHKMLDGNPATCHPAFADGLSNSEYVLQPDSNMLPFWDFSCAKSGLSLFCCASFAHAQDPTANELVPACRRVAERVVVEGNCVTSRGPGTAFEFSLELIEKLLGAEKRAEVAGPMVMYNHQEPASS